MLFLLFFAFISGLVTIAAPCIWPLLPIVLSSAATGGKRKPLGVTLGILVSFGFFTLSLSYFATFIPFDANILRLFAVVVITFFGLVLIIPKLNQILESYVSRMSGKLAFVTRGHPDGFRGGFVTGSALGIVWTPCAGPILATIAVLAATRAVNIQIFLVTVVYLIGVGLPLFIFAEAGNRIFSKSRVVTKYTGRIQQIFGVVMIATALAIYTNYDKVLQTKLLSIFPSYSNFIVRLENNPLVKKQLDTIKGGKDTDNINMPFPQAKDQLLGNYGNAPEFAGISHWLNSDPLTLESLKGKVVLIDFWTYTCINCIRTLPHVTEWYEKYKDKGFVIVGVHTPEFEFEKSTQNVANALKQYMIHYPVAQDNDYATWNAYSNQYWPAKYLIDANGTIRYVHFGEGDYEMTETAIIQLIKEAGISIKAQAAKETHLNLRSNQTPETYLGYARADRFASNEEMKEGRLSFTMPESIPDHYFAYSGIWGIDKESATAYHRAALEIHYVANKVYLVITPQLPSDKIKVLLDGKPIAPNVAGVDVVDGFIKLDTARLYEIINSNDHNANHVLRLEFQTPGTKVFAFTFE